MEQTKEKNDIDIVWAQTDKQEEAWELLTDDTTEELVFGGGAGGAKSFTLCAWMAIMCLTYDGARGLLAREELKDLKESTLLTFFDVVTLFGLKMGRDIIYNKVDSTLTFYNGSVIYLSELRFLPSDPEYERIGSKEYTFAGIDEASQITEKAKNIVRSRIRYKLDEFGLIPKLLMTTNPTKNFIYSKFYKPWRDAGKRAVFAQGRAFIQALVYDNPFIPESYIKTLESLDPVSQERLLRGNWEYENDPRKLIDYDAITDLFTNELDDPEKMVMTIDVARKGSDLTVFTIWDGMTAIEIDMYAKNKIPTSVEIAKNKARAYKIPFSHIIADDDGVGGGLVDYLPGIKAFNGGSSPLKNPITGKPENFKNLRSQCYFKLADVINDREMAIEVEDVAIQKMIIEELEQVKERDVDSEGKKAIIKKDDMKKILGRSPDITDTLMMRMYMELLPQGRVSVL